MKADIYLTTYSGGLCIIGSTGLTANLENEFALSIVDSGGIGNRIPGGLGRLVLYNGKRTASQGLYYSSGTVPLNTTVTVSVNRTSAGVYSMTIGGQSQTVTRATIADPTPTSVYGNVNIPVYVGLDVSNGVKFSGAINNVVLSGGTSGGVPIPTAGTIITIS